MGHKRASASAVAQHIRRELLSVDTAEDLPNALTDALARYGVHTAFVGRFLGPANNAANGVQAQNILAHNVPHDWVREYVRRDWIKWDVRFLGARFYERPYRWREVENFTPMQKEILAAAADWGMKDGLSTPVRMKRCLGGVVLSAPRLKDVEELSEVMSNVCLDVLAHSLMVNGLRPDVHLRGQLFTPRQREILRYVAREMSNEEIGVACGISPETVKEMLSRMARKIGVRGRVGLVAHGFKTRALD